MHKNIQASHLFFAALGLAALACQAVIPQVRPTDTMAAPISSDTPLAPLPSPTTEPPTPTLAPLPTLEPTQGALPTASADPLTAEIKEYYAKGYLPYENGLLSSVPDYVLSQPDTTKIHNLTRTGLAVQDFALWADIELRSIGSSSYPNYSGCGFAYRVQNNDTGYTAILSNDYVRMGACSAGMFNCKLFGTRFGTGQVDVANQEVVRFSLVVNKLRAYALVNGVLVGQYDLYTTRLTGKGDLLIDAVSNYPAGYWSACKITNIKLWESLP